MKEKDVGPQFDYDASTGRLTVHHPFTGTSVFLGVPPDAAQEACRTGRAETERENALTIQMVRAGVSAFQRWNPEEEEIEALVVEIYFSMVKAASCALGARPR